MSAHREHPFIAELEAEQPRPAHALHAALLIAAAFAIGLLVTLPLTLGRQTAVATPVLPAHVETRDLPPQNAPCAQAADIDRLRAWRAGYEAALDNGCRLPPALSSPIGSRP